MKTNPVFPCLMIGVLLIAGCTSAPPPAAKPAKPAPAAAPAPAPVEQVAEPAAPPPPISEAVLEVVEHLTEPEVGGMLHEKAEATGFPQAIASLQAGAIAPSVDQPTNYAGQPPTRGLTADGATAELVERDWTGIVLVPVAAEYAKAYTSIVRLTSIEAHPLTDGRVRTWIRVRNVTRSPVSVGVACRFMMKGEGESSMARYYSLTIPVDEYRDVFFVSTKGQLSNYTVLVRAGG